MLEQCMKQENLRTLKARCLDYTLQRHGDCSSISNIGQTDGYTTERKPWISQEMIDKMEERRQWKNVNTDEGRQKYKS